jgi:hypothetical protein
MNFNKSTISYNVRVCIPIESRVVHTKIQNHHSIVKSKIKLLEKIYFEANELYFNGSSVHINKEEYFENISN